MYGVVGVKHDETGTIVDPDVVAETWTLLLLLRLSGTVAAQLIGK